jgi:hypothetical protein
MIYQCHYVILMSPYFFAAHLALLRKVPIQESAISTLLLDLKILLYIVVGRLANLARLGLNWVLREVAHAAHPAGGVHLDLVALAAQRCVAAPHHRPNFRGRRAWGVEGAPEIPCAASILTRVAVSARTGVAVARTLLRGIAEGGGDAPSVSLSVPGVRVREHAGGGLVQSQAGHRVAGAGRVEGVGASGQGIVLWIHLRLELVQATVHALEVPLLPGGGVLVVPLLDVLRGEGRVLVSVVQSSRGSQVVQSARVPQARPAPGVLVVAGGGEGVEGLAALSRCVPLQCRAEVLVAHQVPESKLHD